MAKTWPSLTFDRFGAIALLRDLGILPAWQSVGLWNPDLDLTERISDQIKSLAHPSSQKSANVTSPSPTFLPNSLSPHFKANVAPPSGRSTSLSDDPADSLRHDFGDLPVYIIDDPGAQELDDGISIELIDQSPDRLEAWVHVHIADPTAHLCPSDPVSARARAYLDTLYLPGFTLPMLPSQFIESHRMSLGSNNKSSRQVDQKTLSFSARINQKGDILEYKIRPGLIRNTKQLTYQVVTDILDGPHSSTQRVIHIGPDSDQMSRVESERNLSAQELNQAERDQILELGKISQILTKRRVDDGAMGWHLPMAQVSIKSHPMVSPSLGLPLAPRITIGNPSFSVTLPSQISDYKHHSWGMSSAQTLVSEMMIMAGRLAGRFYVDESPSSPDLRLAFRSQPSPDLVGSSQNEEAWKELRQSIDTKSGMISPFKFQKSRIMFMPAVNGLEPMSHFPLGINDRFGYCKVTSPLRRYSDLVAHWQIKKALLRRVDGRSYADKQNVLSEKGMKELIDRLDRESKPMVNLDRKMNLSWVSYLLRRMLSDRASSSNSLKIFTQDNDGAESFKGLVHHQLTAIILQDPVLMRFTNRWSFKAYIPELGLRASLITEHVEDWFAKWVHHHHHHLNEDSPSGASPSSHPSLEDYDPVGLRVPVYIAYINHEDHLILKLDPSRPNFLIESTV
ncbi:hypothetical protein PCASD_16413 [Puccinia coronata f. sp. avenae]|uniref:RNB domain-containing protein n=1 Tax=Puccinia coronata f. sp. avenae TaxID=200324 RepID=A0A2N5TCL7_9BASI|nr:hypothetical protein PCASD_16413 [Puccinia coronata f. sp. avenae]